MTKLLDQAIETIKALPEADQNIAAEFLFGFAETQRSQFRLTPEQICEVRQARKEASDGTFASKEAMDSVWRRFGH